MTDPRMTPTNDAPVTVEQCDIDRAARCFTIEGREGDRLREHFADQFARHRLAALASGEQEACIHGADSFGGKDFASAPAGDGELPDSLPGHWDGGDGAAIARACTRLGRSTLCKGDLSDMALANAVYLAGRDDLDLIVWQTAAKERIRWLSAQLAVALARPRAAVGEPLPADVAELVNRIGRAEWGATDALDANEHGKHVADSVRITAANFDQTEPQRMQGLYVEGTETVICHVGTSPNSPAVARALAGAWNHLCDLAALQSPPAEVEG